MKTQNVSIDKEQSMLNCDGSSMTHVNIVLPVIVMLSGMYLQLSVDYSTNLAKNQAKLNV